MKVRIYGNSLRFRLRQAEVEAFDKFGSITETIQLGGGVTDRLHFVLKRSDADEIDVQHADNTTTIVVPEEVANAWTHTEQVGFDSIVEVGDNSIAVKILVEKDFKCIDGNEEDQLGTYPNPSERC